MRILNTLTGLGMVAAILMVTYTALMGPEWLGIHLSRHGRFSEGEFCAVYMDETTQPHEVTEGLAWCQAQYQTWRAGLSHH